MDLSPAIPPFPAFHNEKAGNGGGREGEKEREREMKRLIQYSGDMMASHHASKGNTNM